MTTVATRGDGVLAADTQCAGDDYVVRVTKLHRLPCGGVVGGCGDFPEVLRAIRWLQRPKGPPPELNDSTLLLALSDGRTVTIDDNKWVMCDVRGPVAIGTGRQAAIAAMKFFGTSAEEAVEAAASVDPNTSAPVEVMAVEAKRVRRKAAK